MTVEEAASSNAEWCDVFCGAHGVVGRFDETAWSSAERTPPLYPDAVTLVPGCSVESLLARVDAGPGCSIKDSFADLELSAHGFEVLLEAEWLRQDRARGYAQGWSAIANASELERWEGAWGASPVGGPFFRAQLLGEPGVRILVRSDGQRVLAGAVANRSRGVIGLTNVFDVEGDLEDAWSGAAGAARAIWGALPIVGYDRGRSLDAAHRAGFETIGPLAVWTRVSSAG